MNGTRAEELSAYAVTVTEILEPDTFWVIHNNEEKSNERIRLDILATCEPDPTKKTFSPGDIVVANVEGLWKRARLIEPVYHGQVKMFRGFLVDDGNFVEISLRNMREVCEALEEIPFQAVKVRLSGVSPCRVVQERHKQKVFFSEKWPKDTIEFVREVFRDCQQVWMHPLGRDQDAIIVTLILNIYGEFINFADQLIALDKALPLSLNDCDKFKTFTVLEEEEEESSRHRHPLPFSERFVKKLIFGPGGKEIDFMEDWIQRVYIKSPFCKSKTPSGDYIRITNENTKSSYQFEEEVEETEAEAEAEVSSSRDEEENSFSSNTSFRSTGRGKILAQIIKDCNLSKNYA